MGNFWGDFTQGFTQGARTGMAMAEARRQREEHEHQKEEWQRLEDQRDRLKAAGTVLADPNNLNGVVSAEEYKALAEPPKKGKKGKKGSALPLGVDIAPDSPPEVASTQSLVPGAPPESVSVPTPPPAPQATPTADDYTAVMIGDRIMYAPRSRVKQLDGADLVRSRAQALGEFDPVIGAQLMNAANQLEKGNLEASAARWNAETMESRRIAAADPAAGLSRLAESYKRHMPDLGEMEFAPGRDGSIIVTNYVNTQNGRVEMGKQIIPAVDPDTGLTAVDTIFSKAQSLADAGTYRQHLIDTSRLAAETADLVAKRQQTIHDNALFPLRKRALAEDIRTSEYNRRSDAARTYYDTGIDLAGSFDDNVPTIMQAEGTDNWDAYYGSSDGKGGGPFKAPPAKLSTMTLGDVVKWQRSQSPRVVPGSDGQKTYPAAGGLQITSDNIARFGPRLFGEDWESTKFTPDTQMAIGRAIHAEQGYGAWKGLDRGGMPRSPRARDQMLANRSSASSAAGLQKDIADYITEGLKLIDAPPGSRERLNAVAALRSEAMELYGQMDDAPIAADMTSSGNKRQALPTKAPARTPAPRTSRPSAPPPEPSYVREARGIQRLSGEVRARAERRFKETWGVTSREAINNPASVTVTPARGSLTVSISSPQITRAQLKADAVAAIAQGPQGIARFERRYGQPPQRFISGGR